MPSNKSLSTPTLAIFFSLSPGISIAAEDSIGSIFPLWPFFAIILFIAIFRKQLNCVTATTDIDEDSAPAVIENPTTQVSVDTPEPESIPESSAEIQVEAEIPEMIPEIKVVDSVNETNTEVDVEVDTPKSLPETEDITIDLKDNSQQCQASTAKGTRCKRRTALKESSVTIDNKTYLLSVCRQHNSRNLRPFAELIQ